MTRLQFLHCGDLHLGTSDAKTKERWSDFFDRFNELAKYAVKQKVDFVLVSGDFFNKQQIDPETLEGATKVLSVLKEAGIPVIAVEGNHDNSIYGDETSWLKFLSRKGYLKLLQTKFEGGEPSITPWTDSTATGSYIDLVGGVRVFGVGYCGASTKKKLELIAPTISTAAFNIMLLHAGVNAFADSDLGGVNRADLSILKKKIDYLALGHIHKKYEMDGWIFNPGSLENWRIDEAKDQTNKKGFWHVIISEGKLKETHFIPSSCRPVLLWNVDISKCKNVSEVYQTTKAYVSKAASEIPKGSRPILRLTYVGSVEFSTFQIDNELVQKQIISTVNPLICEISDGANVLSSTGKITILPNKGAIEKEEIEKLVDFICPEYKSKKPLLTKLLLLFKTKALSGENEEQLIDLISHAMDEGLAK